MARSAPIVDERVSFPGLQKCRDIGLPNLHLKRSGHAVQRHTALTFEVHSVLMQINESRSNNQAAGRNHALAGNSLSRDFFDRALDDADIANSIETCFRIDYPATLDHKI